MKNHTSIHLFSLSAHLSRFHCRLFNQFPQMNHYLVILAGFCKCCLTYLKIKLYHRDESLNKLVFDWSCLKIWIIMVDRMARENRIHQAI